MKYPAKDWNVGDVVRLKSGGPLMTVSKVYVYDDDAEACSAVDCIWFPGGDPHFVKDTWGELRTEDEIDVACLINQAHPTP